MRSVESQIEVEDTAHDMSLGGDLNSRDTVLGKIQVHQVVVPVSDRSPPGPRPAACGARLTRARPRTGTASVTCALLDLTALGGLADQEAVGNGLLNKRDMRNHTDSALLAGKVLEG